MIKHILFLSVAALAIGCSPKYYSPNTQNVPLLSQKNELNLSVAGSGNQVEFQGAYAVTNHFAIQANGGIFNPKKEDNGDGGSGKFIEVGAGYYNPITEKIIFEVYGLAGSGSVENDLRSRATANPVTTGMISANMFRYGIQPNIGFKSKYFTAALSSRIVNLRYSNVEGSLIFDGSDEVNYLRDNSSNFLIEPALTIRGGIDLVKLQLQVGRSFNISNNNFRQDNAYATIGLNFRLAK